MGSLPEFALMMTTVIKVEQVIPAVVKQSRNVADPCVVPWRRPVLDGIHLRRGRELLHRSDGWKIKLRVSHKLRIDLPYALRRPPRITKREIVIEQLPVHVHGPAHAGKIEDHLVFPCGLLKHRERNADSHVLPVGMLGGMKPHSSF